jgi:ATP-dependent protease HslVU (ClpYQ) ATPase subunit
MLSENAKRLVAIALANRFNQIIMEFDAGLSEEIVVRGMAYMMANNALGSGMKRDQLVDMLTDLVHAALDGYDIDLQGRTIKDN